MRHLLFYTEVLGLPGDVMDQEFVEEDTYCGGSCTCAIK